jgi:hypothetical protein
LVQVEAAGVDGSRLAAEERLAHMRIVAGSPAWDAQGPRRLVHVGVEALALYAYSRFRDGSDDLGFDRSSLPGSSFPEPLRDVSGGETLDPRNADAQGSVAFESSARRAGPAITWAGSSPAAKSSFEDGDIAGLIHTPFGIVNRVAGQVLDVMSALRAAHLNQFPLRRDLALKLDARTGRRSHFFAVITHRF